MMQREVAAKASLNSKYSIYESFMPAISSAF